MIGDKGEGASASIALPPIAQPDAWQPIETAPKGDTRIYAFGQYLSLYALSKYGNGGPFDIVAVVVRDGDRWRMTTPEEAPIFDVYEAEWDGRQLAYMKPTHWMPLPSPPRV